MAQARKYISNAQRQAAYRKRQAPGVCTGLTDGLPSLPGNRRWNKAVANACGLLEIIRDEMQDYFDQRSERWQEGERGEDFQERIESISTIVDDTNDWL
jgi:hypothetical protein